jgi:hypothetical protein
LCITIMADPPGAASTPVPPFVILPWGIFSFGILFFVLVWPDFRRCGGAAVWPRCARVLVEHTEELGQWCAMRGPRVPIREIRLFLHQQFESGMPEVLSSYHFAGADHDVTLPGPIVTFADLTRLFPEVMLAGIDRPTRVALGIEPTPWFSRAWWMSQYQRMGAVRRVAPHR